MITELLLGIGWAANQLYNITSNNRINKRLKQLDYRLNETRRSIKVLMDFDFEEDDDEPDNPDDRFERHYPKIKSVRKKPRAYYFG